MTINHADSTSAAHPSQSHPAETPETQDLNVIVVGAGFGGLGVARELKQAGVDFLVLEENPEVGGVWWDNSYPGANCDVPSHLYSYDFAPWRDIAVRYPDQRAILSYLRGIADRHGLRPHLRLNTAVAAATYCDDDGRWTITTHRGEAYRADHVVWAVGQLHRPRIPDIPGRSEFAGAAFHSARWDHSVEWAGRDVAVIGTGSSGAQIVPELARTAARVTVYQRTPAWILPKPDQRFGPVTRWILGHVPGAHRLYRAGLYRGADLVLAPIMRGGWSARPATWVARAHLRRQVPDPVLRSKLAPRYRIGEKRILLANEFYPALMQPHVELVTDPIERITADGIRTADGTDRHTDVIVYATGFRAPELLGGIEIRGRNGVHLHDRWARAGRPDAFLGLAVPGFPNMYMIAGPNSFTPANSNPSIKDFQARYIVRCLELSARLGAPIEVTAPAMATYRGWLDSAIADTVWPTGVPAWFKRADGEVTNPWPGTVAQFGRMTRQDPASSFAPVPRPQSTRTQPALSSLAGKQSA
ncbi:MULTISPECIES: flavin-containing monooxygenase [Nocardia]|uniref:flavin-containing monooxygenase n=1 Tax=Nocardia TaxID=1817 RepID=UPI002454CC20|nr:MULTISPECIES: NAD(P)/FAD-dependent oxidoreductase [Nocardia]